MAEILAIFTAPGQQPLKFAAYDGSTAGRADAALGLELTSPRGITYLATARVNWVWPAPTYRVTCRLGASIPATRISCSKR
ncbi:cyclopropane-fatty-acyl-phospholipid synthase domain protein [Mycobacterium kansasii]|nr:cyclopropane-fatty-acyl-phospholipid synthase domain protein [Mycobacterium kansasii]